MTRPSALVAPGDHSIAWGRGYLAYGARTLAEAGVPRIVAATDVANTPTAQAFPRAGYSETGRLCRYHWRVS